MRDREPLDVPLPYGLPEDPQEPYVSIVAPNIDKVSRAGFDGSTVAGRRARRGFVIALGVVVGCAAIAGIAMAVQLVLDGWTAG
ncbi:hypothetical protein [Leifsonia aquatica]|uniref:hypothetical protein n=1 Tax=Leifsonia aquatica TaxID=144185 RepID=UPI000468210D|nr:hypothetical protein [Leifsonia aquatica]